MGAVMVSCGNCKYWGDLTSKGYLAKDYAPYGFCRRISDADLLTNSPAMVGCLSEGIGAEFMTKAEFGCPLFEDQSTSTAT